MPGTIKPESLAQIEPRYPTIGKVENIDWAFVPYWILHDAKENNIEIDAKMKALYHLYPNQKIEGEIPENMIVLRTEGQVIKIPY